MRRETNIRRFISNVERAAPGGCWIWAGIFSGDGYGKYGSTSAHRRSYALFVGPIPDGLEVDHLCRNPRCVNPEHLEAVTRAENMRRRAEAQTHCKHGHEFTPENTYLWTSGKGHTNRHCRTCNRRRSASRRPVRVGGGSDV